MKRKMITALLAVIMAASTIFGGCGVPKESGGRADSIEQTRESRETELLKFFRVDELRRLVRSEDLTLGIWSEHKYDEFGNEIKCSWYVPVARS